MIISARSTFLIIFSCASYHHLHFLVLVPYWETWRLHDKMGHSWYLDLYRTFGYHSECRPRNRCLLWQYQLLHGLLFLPTPIDSFAGCWINSQYIVERLLTDYVWLTGLAIILHPIMAIRICSLAHRLNVVAHTAETAHRKTGDVQEMWQRNCCCTFHISQVYSADSSHSYPIIFILCILPDSISRLLSFINHTVPNRVILAANAIHALSGLLLYNAPCHGFWNSS